MQDNIQQTVDFTADTASTAAKAGYYTVNIDLSGEKIPYVVYATSDYHAARMVRHETGHLASQHDVEGPYSRF